MRERHKHLNERKINGSQLIWLSHLRTIAKLPDERDDITMGNDLSMPCLLLAFSLVSASFEKTTHSAGS